MSNLTRKEVLKIDNFQTKIEKYIDNVNSLKKGEIPNSWNVKVIKAGNEVVVTASSMQQRNSIRKLDKKHYEVLATHEIREYKKHKTDNTRKANFRSLQKSLSHLRNLINTNFSSDKLNQVWITLTYKKHQTDNKQVVYDMKKLIKALRYKYQTADSRLEYIYILEPQSTGSWHVHLLLKLTNSDELYIQQKSLKAQWGKGSAYVKTAQDGIKNIANYVSALLANAKSTQQQEYEIKTQLGLKATKPTKAYEKYSRLKYYQKGMKFYYRSKGIEEPKQQTMLYGDIKKELTEAQFRENYKKVSHFSTSNNTEITTVFIQFYRDTLADTAEIIKPFKTTPPHWA